MRRLRPLIAVLLLALGAAACQEDTRSPGAADGTPPAASPTAPAATAPEGAAPAPDPDPRDTGGLRGRVTRIIDGDTIRVEVRGFETPVRLVGIDAPETSHPRRPVECFGPEATARMHELLSVGQPVRLVLDPTQDARDRYGRLLAYVYAEGADGARGSVNHAMVAGGHARVYVFRRPFRHTDAFLRAERSARAGGRGLWGPACDGDTGRAPAGAAPAPAPPPRAPAPAAGGGCHPSYAGACIPPPPPDVDCGDIAARGVRVVGPDVHRLDRDGDGIACES